MNGGMIMCKEDVFSNCHICEEFFPSDESDINFDKPTCRSCAEKQFKEWEEEDQIRSAVKKLIQYEI
jgi:hypothetical protein